MSVVRIEPRERSEGLLVLLHGYGELEHHVAAFGPLVAPRFATLAPRGPVTLRSGTAAWYRITPGGPDPDGFFAAVDHVESLLDGHDGPVVAGGFSQGGALAVALALRSGARTPIAAAFCMSGYLPEVPGLEYDFSKGVPVLYQHGSEDPMVTAERGRTASRILEDHGVPVTYREYNAGHEVTVEMLVDVRAWLSDALRASP